MRVQMRSEISRLHKALKAIFIYVTHDQVEAMTMGTKIVVLKDGHIQQVASPEGLYLQPKNMFVAGFIGTPQMNFLKAVIRKDKDDYFAYFLGNPKGIAIPRERMQSFNESFLDKEVVLGIRPKSIAVEGELSYVDQGFKCSANLSEQLGEETIVYSKAGDLERDLLISVEGLSKFHEGEEIHISFDLKNVCLFSSESEESLL